MAGDAAVQGGRDGRGCGGGKEGSVAGEGVADREGSATGVPVRSRRLLDRSLPSGVLAGVGDGVFGSSKGGCSFFVRSPMAAMAPQRSHRRASSSFTGAMR